MARRKVTRKKTRAASSGDAARKDAGAKKTTRKSAKTGPRATARKKSTKKAAPASPSKPAASRASPPPAGDPAAGPVGGETALLGRGPGWWAPSRSGGKPGTPVGEEFRREPDTPAEPRQTETGSPIPVGIFAPSKPPDVPDAPEPPEIPDTPHVGEAPSAYDTPDAVEAPDAVGAPDAVEALDAADALDAVAPDDFEAPEAVDASDLVEVTDAEDVPDTLDSPDDVELLAAMMEQPNDAEAPEILEAPDILETPDTVETPDDTATLNAVATPDDLVETPAVHETPRPVEPTALEDAGLVDDEPGTDGDTPYAPVIRALTALSGPPATPDALQDPDELEMELDGADLDVTGDDDLTEASLLADALELLGEAEDVELPEPPELPDMDLTAPPPEPQASMEPPPEMVGAAVEIDEVTAEAATAGDEAPDIETLDEQLAADVDGMLQGDYEAVDDLLDGAFDDSGPVAAASSEITAGEPTPADADDSSTVPEEPVSAADETVEATTLDAEEASGDAPPKEVAEQHPAAPPEPEPEPAAPARAARRSVAEEPVVATPAGPRRPSMIVRTLLVVNYPLRTLPPAMRTVVDWIALSLVFWIPIVWLIAMLVIGR